MREYDPEGNDIVANVANIILVKNYLDEHPGMSDVDAFRCILHERDRNNQRMLATIY